MSLMIARILAQREGLNTPDWEFTQRNGRWVMKRTFDSGSTLEVGPDRYQMAARLCTAQGKVFRGTALHIRAALAQIKAQLLDLSGALLLSYADLEAVA